LTFAAACQARIVQRRGLQVLAPLFRASPLKSMLSRFDSRLAFSCASHFHAVHEGNPSLPTFRIIFKDDSNRPVSPWHNVPLTADNGLFNMVTEIPKFTQAKMEIDTKSEYNPIVQDTKNGKPRFHPGPIYWNYGALPQTWEDPKIRGGDAVFGAFGDNDPVDVVEIGAEVLPMGCITPVKVLGAFSMIDDGELDWKIIAIKAGDPKFDEMHDIGDIDKHYPGTVSGIREWFRWYKAPDGKPLNRFGHNEAPVNRIEAERVITEASEAYSRLKDRTVGTDGLWVCRELSKS